MKLQYDSLEIKEVKVIFDGEDYDPDKKVDLYQSNSIPIPKDSNHIRAAGLGMESEGLYVDIEALKESLLPSRVHTDQLLRDRLFYERINDSNIFTVSIDDSPGIPLRDLETAYVIKDGIDEYLYYQWELESEYELNSSAVDEHRELYNQIFGDKNLLQARFNEGEMNREPNSIEVGKVTEQSSLPQLKKNLNTKLDTILNERQEEKQEKTQRGQEDRDI